MPARSKISAACAFCKRQMAFACFASLVLRSVEYVPPSLCSCTKRRWYPPEKSASPLPFAPANAPPEGEKLLPKESIFLISTAVVQADSRFQYAKAARPFCALCLYRVICSPLFFCFARFPREGTGLRQQSGGATKGFFKGKTRGPLENFSFRLPRFFWLQKKWGNKIFLVFFAAQKAAL